jgi:hypothetical protein
MEAKIIKEQEREIGIWKLEFGIWSLEFGIV